MNENPLEVFLSLGSIHQYKDMKTIGRVVEQIEHAVHAVRDRFESLPSERKRFVYALDVLQELLSTAQHRTETAAEKSPAHAHENDDIFFVMNQWMNFVRDNLLAADELEVRTAGSVPNLASLN